MSTIARGRRWRRALRREAGALSPRAVRVRNALLRHIAARHGLASPSAEELAELGDGAGLVAAVRWWEEKQGRRDARRASVHARRRSVRRSLGRAVVIAFAAMLAVGMFPSAAW
jgi:hypothetical protein